MSGSAYSALASVVVSIVIGVLMAIHPEWRVAGWCVICCCMGILGWATAIFALPKIVAWTGPNGPVQAFPLAVGCAFLLGTVALGLSIEAADGDPTAPGATLRLLFSGGDKLPTASKLDDIGDWYAYFSESEEVSYKTKEGETKTWFVVPRSWVIFVTFPKPVEYREILVSFNSPGFPP
jgi:hypothetical protein